MTHHSVMMSSLRIKILKIDKFGDFSCDIDYNSGQTYLEILCDSRRPQGASGGHKVSASRVAEACEARLYIYIYIYIH